MDNIKKIFPFLRLVNVFDAAEEAATDETLNTKFPSKEYRESWIQDRATEIVKAAMVEIKS